MTEPEPVVEQPPPQTTAPPPPPPLYTSPPPRPARRRALMLVLVLIIIGLSVMSVAGSYLYSGMAVNRLTVTCSSIRTTYPDSAYSSATMYAKFGVQNPSYVDVNANWKISMTFGNPTNANSVNIESQKTFTVPSHGTAYPELAFTITRNDAEKIAANQNSGTPQASVTVTEQYSALLYSFPSKTSTSTPDGSGTSTGGVGSNASSLNLPSCP